MSRPEPIRIPTVNVSIADVIRLEQEARSARARALGDMMVNAMKAVSAAVRRTVAEARHRNHGVPAAH